MIRESAVAPSCCDSNDKMTELFSSEIPSPEGMLQPDESRRYLRDLPRVRLTLTVVRTYELWTSDRLTFSPGLPSPDYARLMSPNPKFKEFSKLLDTARHSDFVIECKGHVFNVHKALICAQSEFFDRLCAGPFQESSSSRVNLEEDDPAIIARILLYIYTDDYPVTKVSEDSPGHGQFRSINDHWASKGSDPNEADPPTWVKWARIHVAMYAEGEKYSVPGLQECSARKFLVAYWEQHRIEEPLDDDSDGPKTLSPHASVLTAEQRYYSSTESLPIIDSHSQHIANPESDALNRVKDRWVHEADLIKLVYESTPSHCCSLRNVVVKKFKACVIGPIYQHPIDSNAMVAVLDEIREFAFDVASTFLSNYGYKCDHCKRHVRALIRRCRWGKVECKQAECLQKSSEESICDNCLHFGTLKLHIRSGSGRSRSRRRHSRSSNSS